MQFAILNNNFGGGNKKPTPTYWLSIGPVPPTTVSEIAKDLLSLKAHTAVTQQKLLKVALYFLHYVLRTVVLPAVLQNL